MRSLLPAADLFDAPALPRGLEYHANFLSADDEATLLRTFVDLPFHEAKFQQYTARRRVDRYGLVFDEERRVWVEGRPLPPFLVDLRERVAASRHMPAEEFVHALVTEYRPGTPIGWHRDKPEYGIVVGISLASACRMRFRPYDNQQDRSAVVALTLDPRSLYVMADEIRWGWQHSIPPAKALRYSITFRTRVEDTRKPR
ncbi:MAG TPA: alpha-ketoglutarate-dependent dioxygenase AlkB [Casimicrobiaceae bacterium]|nr:alpha-ketoglutarate-dependent dioxygenase AlkB [Casimicrobiaceae bacterium]